MASPSAPPSEDLDPAERPVILLVGEDDGLRHELRSRVEWSYRVEEATSGPAALARALDDAPDLVLLDVTLPDIDAVALLAALRDDDRTYDVPVVLLSAGAGCGPTDDVLGLAAGVAGLVTDWEPLLRAPASALGPALDSTDQALLETVDATIRAHMAAPGFGARALAEAVGRSPRHLRRLIAEITGESPAAHVRRIRLERAAELLRNGTRRVKEVSHAVGFASASGFRDAFQEAHGVSPSAYGRRAPVQSSDRTHTASPMAAQRR